MRSASSVARKWRRNQRWQQPPKPRSPQQKPKLLADFRTDQLGMIRCQCYGPPCSIPSLVPEHWGLGPEDSGDMGAIVKELERNPLFQPDTNEYLLQYDNDKGECHCRRLSGWGDWQLTWLYEFKRLPYERAVEGIVRLLLSEPLQLRAIPPKKRL